MSVVDGAPLYARVQVSGLIDYMSAHFLLLHKQGPLLNQAVLHIRALPCRCGWRNTN